MPCDSVLEPRNHSECSGGTPPIPRIETNVNPVPPERTGGAKSVAASGERRRPGDRPMRPILIPVLGALESLLEGIEIGVEHGRHVERDDLREGEAAYHRDAQRTPRLGASARSEGNWKRAHQGGHRCHHDGTK